jgi:radical SAM superfamily enzyme YgiQ (UPF0313 family)
MNIALIYPEMPDTFYAMKHFLKVIGKKATYPPLGLITVASLLPDEWSKKVLDLNLAPLNKEDLKWADFVFLSAMNVQGESVNQIVKQCKQAGVKVVAGGPLFTHEYARFPDIDYFVLNEAEITLPLFLEDLKKGEPKAIYETKDFADITKSPLPDFGLVNMDEYSAAIVQYSRGCPYLCDFCDVTALFGRKPRVKTSEQIIRELEVLNETEGVHFVLFADDNLIGNKKVLKSDLLPALIEWRKKKNPAFYFATQLTVNLADDPVLMELLIDAGFRHIFIGIETPDEDGLKGSRKTQNLKRDQLESIRTLHKAGFIVYGGFIVGLDSDKPSIFQQQVDFIQESGIPLPIINILKAPPGTELFDRMEREGRLKRRFAFTEGETNVDPLMDEKVLYNGFLDLIANVYLPQHSFQRIIKFLSTYELPKTNVRIPFKAKPKDYLTGIRVLYQLGVKDPNRKYFWGLVIWALKNKPKYLDKAMFYSITIYQMYHTYLTIKKTVEEQNKEVLQNGKEEILEAV